MVSNEEQSNIKHFQIYIDQRTEKYKTKGTSNSLAYPMFGYVLLSKVLSCYLATQSLHLDETTAGQNSVREVREPKPAICHSRV